MYLMKWYLCLLHTHRCILFYEWSPSRHKTIYKVSKSQSQVIWVPTLALSQNSYSVLSKCVNFHISSSSSFIFFFLFLLLLFLLHLLLFLFFYLYMVREGKGTGLGSLRPLLSSFLWFSDMPVSEASSQKMEKICSLKVTVTEVVKHTVSSWMRQRKHFIGKWREMFA